MNSKDKNILNNLNKEYSISLKNFLISYCGICNKDLINNKITHKDIKYLLPDLKRVSYEYLIKNIGDVYTGNVLIVSDSFGNFAPYLNPKLNEYEDINIEYECEIEKTDKFEVAVELENLNLYELSKLSKKYKEDNRISEYRKVCRMIKKKKDNGLDKYHSKKEKILMKGRSENDKY